jgi:hypothetical protein
VRNLANSTLDLLCALTFQPANGADPDDLAEVEQSVWQTLIHDLSPAEADAFRSVVNDRISNLEQIPPDSMADHQITQLEVLRQFVSGDLT